MQRYFLEVAYKGTNYSGLQVQHNANSIQAEVENALAILFRGQFNLTGSSRTDTGVHALQNFFHFNADINLSSKNLYNLNSLLPRDIVAKNFYKVDSAAHCRFDRLLDLRFQFGDSTVPGPGTSPPDSQKRQHPLGRSEISIAEIVVEQPVRVAVGVTAMAAHPAAQRESAAVKQPFAPIGRQQLGLRSQRNLAQGRAG